MARAHPSSRAGARGGLRRLLYAAAAVAGLAGVAATENDDLISKRGLQPTVGRIAPPARASRARATTGQAAPLSFEIIDDLTTQAADVQAFVLGTLFPAATSILARSIQLRVPRAGLIAVTDETDFNGNPYPEPPNGAAGYDADVVLRVGSASAADCRGGTVAQAGARVLEPGTNRPAVGDVEFCDVRADDILFDVQLTTHEILHVLGVLGTLFSLYPSGNPASTVNGVLQLTSPQVLSTARTFFDCPGLPSVPFENSGGAGTAGAHWEQRIFDGHLMDGVLGPRGTQTHDNREVLTDLTLALLQDSGWYNVLYGSSGFSSFGYQGGCAFATGTFEEALADPAASRYLCPEVNNNVVCTNDHSGGGQCGTRFTSDGFNRIVELTFPGSGALTNCQGLSAGERCVITPVREAGQLLGARCEPMECSDTNTVLINGQPCDPEEFDCLNDEEMCVNPGFLRCAATLNDCNGQGDCFQGRCFCHLGFGGEDCSVPVCTDGCTDGSPCPLSGFCGVDVCGQFTSGDTDRGVPCNPPLAVPAPAPAPSPIALPPRDAETPAGQVPPLIVVIIVSPGARPNGAVFTNFDDCGAADAACCIAVYPFGPFSYCFAESTCDTESFFPRCLPTTACQGSRVGSTCASFF